MHCANEQIKSVIAIDINDIVGDYKIHEEIYEFRTKTMSV